MKLKPFLLLSSFFLLILLSSCTSDKVECKSYSVESCPSSCVVCPPCEVCSSISCQSESFCKSIGFEREWYENMKARINASG